MIGTFKVSHQATAALSLRHALIGILAGWEGSFAMMPGPSTRLTVKRWMVPPLVVVFMIHNDFLVVRELGS